MFSLWCFDWVEGLYANRFFFFLCIPVLKVESGPRIKLASCKSALVYSTDSSKAVILVLVLLFVALWFPHCFLFLSVCVVMLALWSPSSILSTLLSVVLVMLWCKHFGHFQQFPILLSVLLVVLWLLVASGPRVKLAGRKSALNPFPLPSTRWFILLTVLRRWSRCLFYSLLLCGLFYEAICCMSYLVLFCSCVFSVLLALRYPRLGKRELILVLFVCLFDLRLFGYVCFLFLLVSVKGCDLWLWHFSLTFFEVYCVQENAGDAGIYFAIFFFFFFFFPSPTLM